MKRVIALLLVVVIAATTLSIPAFAYSSHSSGVYNGQTWHAYLTATVSYTKGSFTIPSSGITSITTKSYVSQAINPGKVYTFAESSYSLNGSVSYYLNYSGMSAIAVAQAEMTFHYKSLSGTLYS